MPVQEKESASLMLEHFGLEDEAAELHKAIRSTTKKGILTRDLGGNYDTEDVTKAIIENLAPVVDKA